MKKNKHYYTFHHRIFWFVTVAFAMMATSFVVILYTNEKELKENLLYNRLMSYNDYLNMKIVKGNDVDSVLLKNFFQTTVFDLKGNVLYDSRVKDYSLLKNELNFQEVRHALTKGQGYNDRKVKGYEDNFFYAAKRYNNIVIRSALPFNVSFIGTVRDNALYLSGLLLFFIVLEFFFFKSMFRLGRNINRLNEFAVRVDRDEVIEYSAKFSKNELGEVAQHIIQIYNRLMQTKKALEVEKERVIVQQEEQVRLKRQLTQNVAHELKTPVSSIQGILKLLSIIRIFR
jgi:signal transduction histidine kinase